MPGSCYDDSFSHGVISFLQTRLTSGPGSLGTAKVTGGSGEFAGMDMLGVESLAVRAWRVDNGLLAGEGRLIIELPHEVDEEFPEELNAETE